jgi:nitrogen regulatory protein PII
MHEIKAIIRPTRLDAVMDALHSIPGLPGVTVSRVHAYARQQPQDTDTTARLGEADFVKLETVVPGDLVDAVAERVRKAAHTGRPGDGMIFVTEVQQAIRIRSGERGIPALGGASS